MGRVKLVLPGSLPTLIEGELVAVDIAGYGDEGAGSRTVGACLFMEMVDWDRDQLLKHLVENGQSCDPPSIAQAFPAVVSYEFGDRQGATIVALDEPCRTTLDFFQLVRIALGVWVPSSCGVLKVWPNQ